MLPRALALVLLVQPAAGETTVSRVRFLMGTTCEITADLPVEATEPAFEQIERVENLLSTWRPETELSGLNARAGDGWVQLSPELFELLETAVDWSRRTDGAFNPLSASLLDIWRVRFEGTLPTQAEIDDALRSTTIDSLELDRSTGRARLARGSAVEEGAFGKGYALDLAIEALARQGCEDCLIDFGGQISLRSTSPRRISIADPVSRRDAAITLSLSHGSVSTTSGSEKWFDTPAGRFSHVVDPRTGRALPPRGSVTVVHESALVADLLSTALYVMGPDEGLYWANANSIVAVFIVPDEGGVWQVLTSTEAEASGLGLKALSPEFRLKG